MRSRGLIGLFIFSLAVLAVGTWACKTGRIAIQTSLYDLIGPRAAEEIPAAVRTQADISIPILITGEPEAARAVANDLLTRLPAIFPSCAIQSQNADALTPILNFYEAHSAGLASSETAELLRTPKGRAKLARSALRKAYSPLAVSLFPFEQDPFGILQDFLSARSSLLNGWQLKDGFLCSTFDGTPVLMIPVHWERARNASMSELIAARHRLYMAFKEVASPAVHLYACGVPLHTSTSAERCSRDLTILSLISLIAVIGIAVWALGGWRPLPLFIYSLTIAGAMGFLALLLFFDSIHVMTLVLGTTVIGLVIDYSFHWLLHDPARRKGIRLSLMISCGTTLIGLLPLFFSVGPILQQAGCFLAVALVTALGCVLYFYPQKSVENVATGNASLPAPFSAQTSRTSVLMTGALLLLLASLVVIFAPEQRTDVRDLYVPPTELAQAERILAKCSGLDNLEKGFLVIGSEAKNVTLDDLLAREESLNLSSGTPRLSLFFPSLSRRREVASDIAKLYAEQGADLAQKLGRSELSPPTAPSAWTDLPTALTENFYREGTLLISGVKCPENLPEGITFIQPQPILLGWLTRWTQQSSRYLIGALVLLLIVLIVVYRERALRILLPPVVALSVVLFVLRFVGGGHVNLFHVLASFLLIGMTLDYSIFLNTFGCKAQRATICSLLTSLIGFGALVFVGFPVVSAFGLVLAVGLPTAYCAAALLSRLWGPFSPPEAR